MQTEGGPCAVIAPVQAYILKQLLMEGEPDTWSPVDTHKQNRLLVRAATEIIGQAANQDKPAYRIVRLELPKTAMTTSGGEATMEGQETPTENGQVLDKAGINETAACPSTIDKDKIDGESANIARLQRINSDLFHLQLR